MKDQDLFYELLYAEAEEQVEEILRRRHLLEEQNAWLPLGDIPNNFAVASNQQSDPTGAMVEKIINAIDAVLMSEAFKRKIDPEGLDAPPTMRDAVQQFFGVLNGEINTLSASDQTRMADNIHLVAVGTKTNPNYLIIDRGEGQTPAMFPRTFLSIVSDNKMKIPFVQGKYNAGGLGILPFCGEKNFQLIASRRHPDAPVRDGDGTGDLWGFTLVRRVRPTGGRKSSMYVYLAPGGKVPSFMAEGIRVLPGRTIGGKPAIPYAGDLPYGTCIKLYTYRWGKNRTTITLEARYELEKYLPLPALPFRVTDTRDYTANSLSTTISGGWYRAVGAGEEGEASDLEDGFPAFGEMNLEGIGRLPYQIAVFKHVKRERSLPLGKGVYFIVNGQVHGALPSDFIGGKLKFSYLNDSKAPLVVLVDCTLMDGAVREDFFMADRERARRNETYATILDKLTRELGSHPGLDMLNQVRRQKDQEKYLGEEGPLEAFQNLLNADPTLAALFGGGDRLVTATGPGEPPPFVGRRFPSFFRLAKPKEGEVKNCPVNRTSLIEFETDAQNDYFKRLVEPGEVTVESADLLEHQYLWNGQWETRFRVPWDAQPGDLIPITVTVKDSNRVMPFVCTFALRALAEVPEIETTGGWPHSGRKSTQNGKTTGVALTPPAVGEVRREQWEDDDPPYTTFEALRIKYAHDGGYDYVVNVDNTFLLTELGRAREEDRAMIKFWFKWGLVLAAVGMLKHNSRLAAARAEARSKGGFDPAEQDEEGESESDLTSVGRYCSGLAQVIVPIIRTLSRAPMATPV